VTRYKHEITDRARRLVRRLAATDPSASEVSGAADAVLDAHPMVAHCRAAQPQLVGAAVGYLQQQPSDARRRYDLEDGLAHHAVVWQHPDGTLLADVLVGVDGRDELDPGEASRLSLVVGQALAGRVGEAVDVRLVAAFVGGTRRRRVSPPLVGVVA
jgi:hypothetical protein